MWRLYVTNNQEIIFYTTTAIYIFSNETFKVIKPNSKFPFHLAFYVNNTLYVREWKQGLKKLEQGQLTLVPHGDQFADERIYAMLPYDESKILLITRSKGLFLYDGQTLSFWNTQVTPGFLNDVQVYFCKAIANRYFVLGTIKRGIIILNKKGEIVQSINEHKGLISSHIYDTFQDKDGCIWVATTQGLSQIIINSPFSVYNQHFGFKSSISSSKLISDKLYLGTMHAGLFLNSKEGGLQSSYNKEKFKAIKNTITNILDISKVEHYLFAGHNRGIWVYDTITKTGIEIAKERFIWKFTNFKNHSGILVGSRRGLIKISKKNAQWIAESVKNLTGSIPYLVSLKPQQILMSNDNGVLSKITLNTTLDSLIEQKKIRHFTRAARQ